MIFNNVTLNGDITHSGITLAGDISHTVVSLEPIDTINYTAAKWGYIQGTLSDQTDLITLLNLKADAGSLATVATSGSYLDLTNTPSIPTKVSDLTNDSGFLTENDVAPVATSGDYEDLSNLPSIPTKTSDLTNDSGFVTSVPTKTSDLTNDSNFVADANYVHTDSNFTLGEKGKLASIESGAEENVIEVIKVNGVTQTVTNKEVDLIVGGGNVDDVEVNGVSVVTNKVAEVTVPTKTSDLTNDSGFITSAPVSSVNGQTGAVVISTATTSADGLMSSSDKTKLEAVYADYSSALTALGA